MTGSDKAIPVELRLPPPAEATSAMPGELCLRHAEDQSVSRRLSLYVLDHGLEGLLRGEGGIDRLAVQCDPTLDDMLAAELARLILAGRMPPPGMRAFAEYAALAREGLSPGRIPLQDALEGLFLAIKGKYAWPAKGAEASAAFLTDWSRMFEAIAGAAEDGCDPASDSIFAPTAFARERAFLKSDRDVFAQDVARGHEYTVALPGGPPESLALFLDQPRSALFKQWSRSSDGGTGRGSDLFLAVRDSDGRWVLSTDPAQRLSLKGLATALQEAEDRAATRLKMPRRTWFDGAPFGHTLVASPSAGSSLEQREIEKSIRQWLRARNVARGKGGQPAWLVWSAAAALFIAALAGLRILLLPLPLGTLIGQAAYLARDKVEPAPMSLLARGPALESRELREVIDDQPRAKQFALILAVGRSGYGALPAACADAAEMYRLLRDRFGYAEDSMWLLVDEPGRATDTSGRQLTVYGPPDVLHLTKAIEEIARVTNTGPSDEPSSFVFYYAGHGDKVSPDAGESAKTIGYLVLQGYWEKKNLPAYLRGFDMGYLSRYVSERVGASHQLLLIDCCFSGLATVARGQTGPEDGRVCKLWKKRAHVIVTAATDRQAAYEEASGRSLFTKELLRALGEDSNSPMLADRNGDGIVTDDELGSFLRSEVPKDVPQGLDAQNPVHFRGLHGDDVGQFLFIPGRCGARESP